MELSGLMEDERGKNREEKEKRRRRESRGSERAFNFKNGVGGWIGAFVQSLV